ncbi:hypothetical protein [Polymorphobacter multimanifer]|uniref:Uncharacterized protein n=1 Tax=Polymorphobacter multimanifer TaxID=1070431 RepID=A0A841LFN2_9SPHN|nr:hypothetical protein [Polymorphobacter multimanifer]MBB6228615.1 hypothetical protein [Polymorphobacter multimanifer]
MLASADRSGMADHRHEIPLAAHFDPQHTVAGLGTVKGDALDSARKRLGAGPPGWLR